MWNGKFVDRFTCGALWEFVYVVSTSLCITSVRSVVPKSSYLLQRNVTHNSSLVLGHVHNALITEVPGTARQHRLQPPYPFDFRWNLSKLKLYYNQQMTNMWIYFDEYIRPLARGVAERPGDLDNCITRQEI